VELREEVKAQCAASLFRRDLTITYSLYPLPGDPNKVVLESEVEYWVVNTTLKAQPHTHIVGVAKMPRMPADFEPISNVGAEHILDELTRLPLSYDERPRPGKKLGDDTPSGFDCIWRREVRIPESNHTKAARFWSTRKQIFPKEASDTFYSLLPTIGISVTVRHDPSFEVRVDIPRVGGDLVDLKPTGYPPRWHRPDGFGAVSALSIAWREKGPANPLQGSF